MSANKDRLLKLIQDKYGEGQHPILVMAEIAFAEANKVDVRVRLDAAKSIMPYIEATRKSIEVKGDLGANVGLLRVKMITDETTPDDSSGVEEDL